MKRKPAPDVRNRRGTIAILAAIMMTMLLGMAAFSVDFGYILTARTDLQAAADAAALAAVRELVPDSFGSQYYSTHLARERVREYANSNINSSAWFQIPDSDIELGRFDPSTIYSGTTQTLLLDGILDTVRVTLRQDGVNNDRIPLFFARVLGFDEASLQVTATAVLQKASIMKPGADVLPFCIPLDVWDARSPGEIWSVYGDGKLEDASGSTIPGNWGTVDIGSTTNSTADMRDQILNGLRQGDLDALNADGRIPQDTHIDSTVPLWVNGDPGLSSGIKSAVEAIHGEKRMIPIYDALGGKLNGANVEVYVVKWGVIIVVSSNWNGAHNTYVNVQKSYTYDSYLRPQLDLSIASGVIDGAFASPMLIE